MRFKVQVRNQAGMMETVVIDPFMHMAVMNVIPRDLEYLSKHVPKDDGSRVHLGWWPLRLKVMMGDAKGGSPQEMIFDRTRNDWLATELNAAECRRLLSLNPGPESQLCIYAGPPGKTSATQAQIQAFRTSEWPQPALWYDLNEPVWHKGGIPGRMSDTTEGDVARIWIKDWPPQYHSTHRSPTPKLILPGDVVSDAPKDGV